jgi:hypothetical protein
MEWIQVEGAASGGNSYSMAVLLGVGLLLIVLGLVGGPSKKRRKGQFRQTKRSPSQGSVVLLDDSLPLRRPDQVRFDRGADQMRVVEENGYERKRLLNREEERLLPILERAAREAGQGYRVMAQVSLGEVIQPAKSAPQEAYAAINSKRLDFAIFDSSFQLVCAVEHQGSGHYQRGALFRDAVKREALRKAGVRVIETGTDVTEEGLRRQVLDLLGAPVCSPGNTSGIEQPAPR